MKAHWILRFLFLPSLLFGWLGRLRADDLEPAPSPVDNPLKGLVPYADPLADQVPPNMEFSYLPLSDLMVGKNDFQWQSLEKLLDDIASRGNHVVFRIYLEYPGKTDDIPRILEEQGLKVHEHQNTNTASFRPTQVRRPDDNPPARAAKETFVAVRFINPLPNGKPLRFANKNQDQHAVGWLTLGKATR